MKAHCLPLYKNSSYGRALVLLLEQTNWYSVVSKVFSSISSRFKFHSIADLVLLESDLLSSVIVNKKFEDGTNTKYYVNNNNSFSSNSKMFLRKNSMGFSNISI